MNRVICLALALPALALADDLSDTGDAVVETPSYVGVEHCKICHLPHFESWNKTRMSGTYELLKPGVRAEAKRDAGLDPDKDYTGDATCLKCHVTGYGRPGGFVSFEETPGMAGVQCEMCHGPGSLYAEMMLRKRGTYKRQDYLTQGHMRMPSAANNMCTQSCHNTDSPFIGSGFEFDFGNRKAIGTHRHNLNYIDMPFDWYGG